tara:strand:+ start:2069 stop:2764 length:696 start_codon:yes stop_codon:yes gene_type:complete
MSDKKVLKESTIRKMMKLANIPALSEKFIQENYYAYNEEDEVEVEDELALDVPMDEPPMDDVEMDAEMELEEPAGDDLPAAEKLVTDLMDVISDHFPEVVIDVDTEEPAGEEEVEMDAEVELEEPMPEEPMDDMGGEELELDAEVEEEEPMMETDLEEEESFGAGIADAAGEEEEATQDRWAMDEEYEGEVDAVEVVEEDPAHNALIDAIAAKVAERLLAEAKKTKKTNKQ